MILNYCCLTEIPGKIYLLKTKFFIIVFSLKNLVYVFLEQYVVSQKSLCFYEHVTLQRKSHNIEVSFHDQNVEPVVFRVIL